MNKIAIFGSGGGSNFQAISEAVNNGIIQNCSIELAFCNKENAYFIERAKKLNICCYSPKNFQNKNFENELLDLIVNKKIDIICLAGYMKMISKDFLIKFNKPVINIHPSLLPLYPGLNAIDQALDNNDKFVGITTHFVDENMDTGKIIFQSKIDISENLKKDKDQLMSLIHKEEHMLYIKTINYVLNNKE